MRYCDRLICAAWGTPFGRHEGHSALDLMDEAAALAIDRSGSQRSEIDGVLCGYATTLPT